MQVFRKIVLSSAIAGLLVGLIITLVQQIGTTPLILRSEVYERAAELSHSQTVGSADVHNHDGSADHEHSEAIWVPAEGIERTAYSAAANVLTAAGFALLLCGFYGLRGDEATWRTGLLWGLGGFIVFVAAPSLSLPPELPGMPAAALEPRQAWWIATVAATALGLGLLAFRASIWTAIFALILVAMPHLIGAPQPLVRDTNVPPTLVHEFAIAVTLTGLLFWVLLGSLTAAVYRRLST